jgi:hypothetical protein
VTQHLSVAPVVRRLSVVRTSPGCNGPLFGGNASILTRQWALMADPASAATTFPVVAGTQVAGSMEGAPSIAYSDWL